MSDKLSAEEKAQRDTALDFIESQQMYILQEIVDYFEDRKTCPVNCFFKDLIKTLREDFQKSITTQRNHYKNNCKIMGIDELKKVLPNNLWVHAQEIILPIIAQKDALTGDIMEGLLKQFQDDVKNKMAGTDIH